MNSLPPPRMRSASNNANIGAGAQVEQIALGTNITQIKGYTAEQVGVLISALRASYQPKPFDGRSPYVGLASFQEQDADRFFGRETLIQSLVARVRDSRFPVIAGPSGSGKSSLARAGLLPALKRGAIAGSEHWLFEILTPGRHPLTELGRVVGSLAKNPSAGDALEQKGSADPTLLHRWAEIALGDQRNRRAVIFIDQFEETFTQVADEAERAAFLRLVTYAATVKYGRVTIVCTTRSDFIGNWAAYPDLNAQLSYGVIQILPMQSNELVSAIARPALQVGLQIEPALVKQVLDDMQNAPGALPLMQFALDDLFQYTQSKGGVIALTRDAYLERGGLQQALARHADAEFARLESSEQQIARTIFSGLIEPGRGTLDTKRTALFSELVPAGSDPLPVKQVLEKLAGARLVTVDMENQRETATLAHERLIDAWGWLRRLVDENREAITLQNEIAEDAQVWAQNGRSKDYLYGGARLATAQEEVKEKKIRLNELAQEFVSAARRRQLLIRTAIIAALVLVSGLVATLATLGVTGSLAALYFQNLPMAWLDVPAGEFTMGLSIQDFNALRKVCEDCPFDNELPSHPVYLDAFKINQYEVTNREYRQCDFANLCDPPDPRQRPPQDGDNYPVTGIKWQDAQTYCERSGGRLPTEAEWEKAARGILVHPEGGPLYPWGYTWDPSLANVGHGLEGETMPVGSFTHGKSPYDVQDMAGNVSEWVGDWYESDYDSETLVENPTGPTLPEINELARRVFRGGSYADGEFDQRVTKRAGYTPSRPSPQIGFRCVRKVSR